MKRSIPVSRHRLLLAGALAASAAVACAAQVDQKAPEPEVPAQEAARAERHHFHGPVAVVIETAKAQAQLTATQRATLDTIAEDLKLDRADRIKLRERLRASAVNVIRSGVTDSKEFESSVSEATRAFEERLDQHLAALEEVHATLTPEQRKTVAAALRTRIDEKYGAKDAAARGERGVKRFTKELMLSKLQVDKLKTLRKELFGEKQQLRPSREELHELVNAFEGDDFRTALNSFRAKKAVVIRSHAASAGKRADSVLTIFTPEQREILADLILHGPRKVLLGDAPAETPTQE